MKVSNWLFNKTKRCYTHTTDLIMWKRIIIYFNSIKDLENTFITFHIEDEKENSIYVQAVLGQN